MNRICTDRSRLTSDIFLDTLCYFHHIQDNNDLISRLLFLRVPRGITTIAHQIAGVDSRPAGCSMCDQGCVVLRSETGNKHTNEHVSHQYTPLSLRISEHYQDSLLLHKKTPLKQ